jgi:hypothetical protein
MVKYIYQAVALVFIFAGALFLFGRNMETDMEEKGVTEAITDETYPYLQLQTQGQTVNVLYGRHSKQMWCVNRLRRLTRTDRFLC